MLRTTFGLGKVLKISGLNPGGKSWKCYSCSAGGLVPPLLEFLFLNAHRHILIV
jgi:hypothetical protein